MTGSRLSKFTLISGAGWALDLLVLLGLVAIGLPAFGANIAGALCGTGLVFCFAQQRVFTQGSGGRIRWRLLLPYLLWQCLAILAASGLVHLLAPPLSPAAAGLLSWSGLAVPLPVLAAALAKIAVTPVTLYANFLFFGWLAERRISWS